MSFTNLVVPAPALTPVTNWVEKVFDGVSTDQLGVPTAANQAAFAMTLQNAIAATTPIERGYTNNQLNTIVNRYNQDMLAMFNKVQALEQEMINLRGQMTHSPAVDTGNRLKVPEPPTFQGTSNKGDLADWVNQIMLYCSASNITDDKQKIVVALTRLRGAAAKYMQNYFNKNTNGEDLGTFKDFIESLTQLYGKRDDMASAKEEIAQMWSNTDLAKKDFLKYAEQYQTLASLVNYPDELHIDKLQGVMPVELRNALVGVKLIGKIPKEWKAYLDLQVDAYKQIHPDKVRSSIFGNGKQANGNNNGGGKAKDPNAMEIDNANRSKEGGDSKKRFCQICFSKGQKSKSKTHNTVDCYDKPGNESKRPKPRTSMSSPPGHKASGSGSRQSGAQPMNIKARLLEFLGELQDDEDDSDSPSDAVNVNTAQLNEDIDDSQPVAITATPRVDEVEMGKPSSRKGGKGKKLLTGSWRQPIEDFQKNM